MRDSVGSEERLQHRLAEITRLLETHRVLEVLASRQEGPRRDLVEQLQHRQNLAELHKHLRVMHAADIANVLGRCHRTIGGPSGSRPPRSRHHSCSSRSPTPFAGLWRV